MSGPKLSQAEIERRRQQQLQHQREEYIRCMTQLRQQKNQIKQWLESKTFQELSLKAPVAAQNVRDTLLQKLGQLEDLPTPDMTMLNSYLNILMSSVQNRNIQLQKLPVCTHPHEKRHLLPESFSPPLDFFFLILSGHLLLCRSVFSSHNVCKTYPDIHLKPF